MDPREDVAGAEGALAAKAAASETLSSCAPTVARTASISVDEVRRIAGLAHLVIEPGEEARYARELCAILGYVQQLEDVDVEGVAPTARVSSARAPGRAPAWLRADEPGKSLPAELALREAPRVVDEGFAVPAFVDDEGGGRGHQ